MSINEVTVLPDGSGFATVSYPLPTNHWLTAEHENVPGMPFRIGVGPQRDLLAEDIRIAAKYAIRASTMNGKVMDFDPDAMVLNMIIGLLGYWTSDGKSRL